MREPGASRPAIVHELVDELIVSYCIIETDDTLYIVHSTYALYYTALVKLSNILIFVNKYTKFLSPMCI